MYILFYTRSTESIRYFLLVVAIVTWTSFSFINLYSFIKLILLEGLICSLFQMISGSDRVMGFTTSPPQFSCILLVIVIYLTIIQYNTPSKVNFCLICCAIVLSFLTGTRSTFLASLGFPAMYYAFFLIRKTERSKRKIVFYILAFIAICILITFGATIMDVASSKMNRSQQLMIDSNRTRGQLLQIMMDYFKEKPIIVLFGERGGFIEQYLKAILNVNGYFPVHQDYILIIAEYGILGLLWAYYIFLKNRKSKWLFVFFFTICSFHNVLLASRTMLLAALVCNEIDNSEYSIFIN